MTDTTNHAEVIREAIRGAYVNPDRILAALDALTREASVLRGEHAMNAEAYRAQSARIAALEEAIHGMLAMYAAGPNDDDWVHPAVKFARAALAPKEAQP